MTEEGDTVAVAASDPEGFYSLTAPRVGSFSLLGSAFGYVTGRAGPFEREEGAVRVAYVELDPEPIPVEGLDVEAYDPVLVRHGFYDRMRAGKGQFLTPRDVAERGERLTPGLFFGLDYVQPRWSEAPAPFTAGLRAGERLCGVVVIWTKWMKP